MSEYTDITSQAELDVAIAAGKTHFNITAAVTVELRMPAGVWAFARERRRVFCASLADVFEDWQGPILDRRGTKLLHNNTHGVGAWEGMGAYARPATLDDMRRELFQTIDATPWLDWLILTKRPENIRRMWPPITGGCGGEACCMYRSNVWLLTSIATQADANRNLPELRACRDLSPVLGLSVEPLLEPVKLISYGKDGIPRLPVDWVIVGGESGPHARPCEVAWVRSLLKQCRHAHVPCFVKQLGANVRDRNDAGFEGGPDDAWNVNDVFTSIEHHPDGFAECYQGAPVRVRLGDSKGGDPGEWPADLRVRELPQVSVRTAEVSQKESE